MGYMSKCFNVLYVFRSQRPVVFWKIKINCVHGPTLNIQIFEFTYLDRCVGRLIWWFAKIMILILFGTNWYGVITFLIHEAIQTIISVQERLLFVFCESYPIRGCHFLGINTGSKYTQATRMWRLEWLNFQTFLRRAANRIRPKLLTVSG
jgi:hypothetical protein